MGWVLDDPLEVPTVLQVHWFLPHGQLHGRVEEENPVVTRPDHTPMEVENSPQSLSETLGEEQSTHPSLRMPFRTLLYRL